MVAGQSRALSVEITGPAGVLEGAIDQYSDAPVAIAVVCHPHPLHGGSMNHKVVTTVARAFARLGAAAVRFNFRSVGASTGAYADGVGERADAESVVAWARAHWPGQPLYLAGFSFGAAVALAIAARVGPQGLIAIAPPIDRLPADFEPPACPWVVIHGRDDEVVPAQPVFDWCAVVKPPPRLLAPDGVGHFFHGQLGVLAAAVDEQFGADLRAPPA